MTEQSKFVCFDDDFVAETHFELADGSRTNDVVKGKGKASELLHDIKGKSHKVMLENVLYVPSYKQDIFSVQAATERGTSIEFNPEAAELKDHDCTNFLIEKQGRLYYLNKAEASNLKVSSPHCGRVAQGFYATVTCKMF